VLSLLCALVLTGCVVPLPVPVAALPHGAERAVQAPSSRTAPPAAAAETDAAETDAATPRRATPEESIAAYMAAIAANDLDAVFAVAAAEEVAAQSDFVATAERLRVLMPMQSLAPSEYPFYVDTNEAVLRQRIATSVVMLAYSLLADVPTDALMRPQSLDDPTAQSRLFADAVDPNRLAGLEVLATADPATQLADAERASEFAEAQARTLGADEVVERVALIGLDGESYLLGFSLVRFGDEWKVLAQNSALAGTPAIGTATPISAAEFAATYGN
jgi:hypothetical protein